MRERKGNLNQAKIMSCFARKLSIDEIVKPDAIIQAHSFMTGPLQVFNEPVDAKLEGLPDYHLIIDRPMDLGTIKKKLNSRTYTHPKQFVADVRLTFANAKKYNPETHEVHRIAQMLEAIFEAWWKGLATKMDIKPEDAEGENSWSRESCATSGGPDFFSPLAAGKKNDRLLKPKIRKRLRKPPKPHPSDPYKRDMRPEEIEKLKVDLELLPVDKVERVAKILESRQKPVTMLEESEEVMIELANLDNDTLWELDRFIRNYKKSRGKKTNSSMMQSSLATTKAIDIPACNPDIPQLENQKNEEVDIDIVDDMPPVPVNHVVIDPESCESDSDSTCSDNSDSTCKSDPKDTTIIS